MTRNTPERRRSPASGRRAGRSGGGGYRRSRSTREDEERRRRRREEEEEEERRRYHRSRGQRHRRSRSSSRDRTRRQHRSSSRGSRRRTSRSRSRRSASVEKRQSNEREKSGAGSSGIAKMTAASDGASALQVAAARAAALQSGIAAPAAVTPQLLIQQSLAVANEQAKALTGIGLPSYYNPTAVNPLKYAEQMQKRKLLWQNKAGQQKEQVEEKPSSSCAKVWEKMTFSQDEDGKMTAKFRKLMGIKGEVPQALSEASGNKEDPLMSKQEKIFRDLDQQYEMARISTHTQRGVGLGYSSQMVSMYSQMPVPK